jgi:hypothetical protein
LAVPGKIIISQGGSRAGMKATRRVKVRGGGGGVGTKIGECSGRSNSWALTPVWGTLLAFALTAVTIGSVLARVADEDTFAPVVVTGLVALLVLLAAPFLFRKKNSFPDTR